MDWTRIIGQSVTLRNREYRAIKLLGAGGFGAVFLVRAVAEAEEAALKLQPLDWQDTSGLWERGINEVCTALRFRHNNVVELLDGGVVRIQKEPFLFQCMPVATSTLQMQAHLLRAKEDRVREVIVALARSLVYLHETVRVVHRDLKPANVLLVDGEWKLADYGCVRHLGEESAVATGIVMGTSSYAPPEWMSGLVSPSFDIWSLGVIAHELLTGTPGVVRNADGGLRAVIQPGLPGPFDSLIRRCFHTNPKQRPSAADVLQLLGADSKVEGFGPMEWKKVFSAIERVEQQVRATAALRVPDRRPNLFGAIAVVGALLLAFGFLHWQMRTVGAALEARLSATEKTVASVGGMVKELPNLVNAGRVVVPSETPQPKDPVRPQPKPPVDTPIIPEFREPVQPKRITVGTARADVLTILGEPSAVSSSHITYGNCYIYFSLNARVESWNSYCTEKFGGRFVAK